MTILESIELPSSESEMAGWLKPKEKIFLCFVASKDPETGRMWCSDCRDTHANVECHFNHSTQTKRLAYIDVGNKEEWKDPNNHFRKNWNITAIPTLVKYVRGPLEETKEIETDRMVEKELHDGAGIKRLRDQKSEWGY